MEKTYESWTVAHLIEVLQQLPPEMKVLLYTDCGPDILCSIHEGTQTVTDNWGNEHLPGQYVMI